MTNSVLCLSYCTHVQREIEIKPFTAAQWALAVPLIERVLHKVQSVCGSRVHATTPGKRRRTPGGFGPHVTNAARLRLVHAYVLWALYTDLTTDSRISPPSTSGCSSPTRHGLGGFASLVVRRSRPTNGFGSSLPAFTRLTTDSGFCLLDVWCFCRPTDLGASLLSGATAPIARAASRRPGALRRLCHRLGGFASLIFRVPFADLATDSGALPPSSSGASCRLAIGLGLSFIVRGFQRLASLGLDR